MPDTSARLSLPYLMPAQAQKHVTHNEALERLDVLAQLTLRSLGATTPPSVPQEGEVHALGAGASGDWAGQDGKLAAFTGGAWLFLTPAEGWAASLEGSGSLLVFSGGGWSAATAQTQNLAGLGVNTTSDATNRLAVAAPATLLSHEGAGHQVKVNKAGLADTASLLFQTGWSGRAEMGLAGSDDFSVKVSADGSTWSEALRAEAATGHVQVPRLSSTSIQIADDATGTVLTPGAGGFALITVTDPDYPQASHSGIFVYDTGPSRSLLGLALGPGMASGGTTTLTGTTGTDGDTTVAAANDALLIENRFGSPRTFSITFLGGH